MLVATQAAAVWSTVSLCISGDWQVGVNRLNTMNNWVSMAVSSHFSEYIQCTRLRNRLSRLVAPTRPTVCMVHRMPRTVSRVSRTAQRAYPLLSSCPSQPSPHSNVPHPSHPFSYHISEYFQVCRNNLTLLTLRTSLALFTALTLLISLTLLIPSLHLLHSHPS
jgi:hypothetical protein